MYTRIAIKPNLVFGSLFLNIVFPLLFIFFLSPQILHDTI